MKPKDRASGLKLLATKRRTPRLLLARFLARLAFRIDRAFR
jgi:hypothetical protein